MARRDFVYQQPQRAGGLVPYRRPADQIYVSPLLPFERELISLIGCTEDEYRYFQEEVKKNAGLRPAEYAGIPDVQATATTIAIISLVVGVASTAASYFLAPKPRQPQTQQQQQSDESSSVTLDSASGRSRFNQTEGLGGSAPLTKYNTRIPIVFGRWQTQSVDGLEELSGGIFITPSLVWSRMLSYGTYQGFRGMYVVGEYGVSAPQLEGVYIGNNALDGTSEHNVALYWSSEEGGNRITRADLFAGTQGDATAGNPDQNEEIFSCPTAFLPADRGHSASVLPSNSTEFGAYAPLYNGTAIKVNFKIIPWAHSYEPSQDAARDRNRNERSKIVGQQESALEDGMGGLGRLYSSCQGLFAHNGVTYQNPTYVDVQVGDNVTYLIKDLDLVDLGDVRMDDVQQRIASLGELADDALQLGETFMIGRMLFQVSERPADVWERGNRDLNPPEYRDAYYTLTCIEGTNGSSTIRIAGLNALLNPIISEGVDDPPYDLGPLNFPLMRVGLASYRNTRKVECTEFGIRSQVYQQLNNLCNFPSLPSPSELRKYDDDKIGVQSGVQQRYIDRVSAWTILVRPAGGDELGNPCAWANINEQFCILNNSPTSVFNYIRIKTSEPRQMEYKFVPIQGAMLQHLFSPEDTIWELTHSTENYLSDLYTTTYGEFRITVTGKKRAVGELLDSEELTTQGSPQGQDRYEDAASAVEIYDYLPASVSTGRLQWYLYYRLGNPSLYQNQTRATTFTYTEGSRSVTVEIVASTKYHPENPTNWNGWVWDYQSLRTPLIYGSVGWSVGDTFDDIPSGQAFGHQYGARYRITNVDLVFVPGTPAEASRNFEKSNKIADTSFYEEISKSNDSGPEHIISYVNESLAEDPAPPEFEALTTMGVVLRSGTNFRTINEISAWVQNGVSVRRFGGNDTVGPGNKFSDLLYFLLTDKRAGLGNIIDPRMIDEEGFHRTAQFCIRNRIFFNGVVAESINLRQWMGQIGPLCLSNFVVKNGRFTVEPALPTDDLGNVIHGALVPVAMFSSGNIIEGSFNIGVIERQERLQMRAAMTWRNSSERNVSPLNESFLVKWADESDAQPSVEEAFDMSSFCTTKHHAYLAARYVMSLRRRVTHVVTFKTTPDQANIAPGALIRVETASSPYSMYNNGVVLSDGTVQAFSSIADGTYSVNLYRTGSDQVETGTLVISNGRVADQSMWGVLFSVENTTTSGNYYQVEEVSLDEDGLVEVKGSHHPTTADNRSVIVADVFDESLFEIIE